MASDPRDLVAGTPKEQLAAFYAAGFKSNGDLWERRLYKRIHMRIQRADAKKRVVIAERGRKSKLRNAEKNRASLISWRRRHRTHVRQYNRSYRHDVLRYRCSFCLQPGNRRHPLRQDKRHEEKVWICRKCAA